MCDLNPTTQNLLSGFVGSVIGAGATVWATNRAIKASAAEYERRRGDEQLADYAHRLDALRGEVAFNLGLKTQATNKKIPVFVHAAWENFMAHSNRLDGPTLRLLADAYGWAIFHNSAAKLERVGVENFGTFIEHGFDRAIERFEELDKKLRPENS